MAIKLYSVILGLLTAFLIYIGFIHDSYKVGYYVPTNKEERLKIIKEWEYQLEKRPFDPIVLKNLGLYLARNTYEMNDEEHTNYTIRILRRALEYNPDEYEIMAILGNVISFSTHFVKNDSEKIRSRFNEGIQLLDNAVKMAPRHMGVKLQRAYSSYYTPTVYKRTGYAISDFKEVLGLVGNDFGPYFKAETLYHLGTAYEMLEDYKNAKLYLKEAINLKLPDNVWINKSESVLKELEEQ